MSPNSPTMIYLLPHIFLTILTASAGASCILGRNNNDTILNPPSTTDIPAPETTQQNSTIAHAYQAYIQNCGPSFQDEKDAAFNEYKQQSNPAATEPTSLDFLLWAYANYVPYRAALAGCSNSESTYKQMLATFTPDTSSQASGTGAASPPRKQARAGEAVGPKKEGIYPPFHGFLCSYLLS
ncbi:hypothetical protein C8R44DRAFT_875124 [Mycena epipterygia]|nr:hypothetical protein C8R44DRAFT_875124 [Mycena epipterygia]